MEDIVKRWYEGSYQCDGIKAQRRYPNEELCRFMGRNFFDKDILPEIRKAIKILEVGCGSCGNLWMLAAEGFDTYGCDLSETSLKIGQSLLNARHLTAKLQSCNMMNTPYSNSYFDAVVDIFSSYCLCRKDYLIFLNEIKRILKPDGVFFSYFPSKNSDTYLRSTENTRIDSDTLTENNDERSPYYGNLYPFRFMSKEDAEKILTDAGFSIRRLEATGKTYDNGTEYFEWLVFEVIKK